ncbi:MAG: arsenic efflux protein [Clostridium sp.]|nr:arsenic efflux protein [Clostridium sp.]
MLDVLLDAVIDSLKILPFLFLAYLAMEWIESRESERTVRMIRKSGRFGPVVGGVLGILPQCGFSAAAANLYAGRVITIGTLLAVFLSTSDEMLPILFSETANGLSAVVIVKILALKAGIGMLAGLLVDAAVRKNHADGDGLHIHDLCEHDHCHCEKGILYSAAVHTAQMIGFIFAVTLALGVLIHFVGEDTISALILNRPVLGELLAGLVGLIPNCAASVVLTQLYVQGAMGGGAMMAGLFVSAGVGILVLCRTNHRKKENVWIVSLLYVIGVTAGMLVSALGWL